MTWRRISRGSWVSASCSRPVPGRSSRRRRHWSGRSPTAAASCVPGAQVVAVNAGTKDTYEATTNSEGYYHIPFVRPGKYEITITISSFQTFKTTGVEVGTNQVVRTNATLQVGGVTESVNVSAEAQVLDTDRATVSETIGQRAIVELPLSGRNVWSLASTTPGVLGGLNSDIGLSFRGAGQREIQNSLSLDGINSSSNLLAATSMRPIADAVTEIQVQTGSTSAEDGAYLGVHINVVTKSGTNGPHGTIFEFYQDSALDSRGYFENTALPKNPRERNQFGAQMDGPVVIPGLYDGRNKTFFMGAYEGVRGDSDHQPVWLGSDGGDAAGRFLGNHRPRSGIPSPDSRSRATSFRSRCCRRRRSSSCSTTRRRTGPAPPTICKGRAPTPTTWTRSWPGSIRISGTKSG